MKASEFVPRLTRPEAGNKYYIRTDNGGYSRAIKGSPTDPECNVLSNCVGYAYGRFNEIAGFERCIYLRPVNAELFFTNCGNCERGDTPRVGACMCWQKGATLSGEDGAGHVAIVERVISESEVVTSESQWGSKVPFSVVTRKKGSNGRWGMGSSFTFQGFIYNPAIEEDEDMDLKGLERMMDQKIAAAVPVYGNIEAVPEWYRPSVQKLIDRGVIRGTDDTGTVLNKTDDFCQIVTVLDRLGLLG